MSIRSFLPRFGKSELQPLSEQTNFSLEDLRKEVDSTFERFFSRDFWKDSHNHFMPTVNISEDEKGYELAVEVPGMKRDDIHLEIIDNRLFISGEKKAKTEEKKKNYYKMESSYGSFKRSFLLDESCDKDQIEASMKDGVLNVKIHKLATAPDLRKKIEISG